jgi:NADH-quinone oxidoreductase subunit N
LIGVANSAIGAYYYLRIIVVMYMRESRKEIVVAPVSFGLALALTVSIFATLYLGILPNRVLQVAQHSAVDLLPQAGSVNSNVARTPPQTPLPGH